jgi:hypothetical protein
MASATSKRLKDLAKEIPDDRLTARSYADLNYKRVSLWTDQWR